MARKQKYLEIIKTVAIVFLMVALVCSCLIYMLSFQNTGRYTFTKNSMQTLSAESVKYQYTAYMDRSYISPKFIGFSAKEYGEDIGFYTLGGEHADVYAALSPFLEKLFSAEGKMTPLSKEEGHALFQTAIEDNHIYLVYENDLPKSLIYAMTAENALLPATSGEYLREILILPDRYLYDGVSLVPGGIQVYTSIHTFCAIGRDSEGNYYRYTTEYIPSKPEDVSFNTNYYLTYTTTDSYFEYQRVQELSQTDAFTERYFSERITDMTMIPIRYKSEMPFGDISVSPVPLKTDLIKALLASLLINPEQVTSFTDADGVRSYYDEGRNVSLSPKGRLEYTAYGEEGLPLSDLLEYPATGEVYDLRDYLGASLILARALENAANASNPCDLFLSGVYTENEMITIIFGYAADGLPVYFDGNTQVLRLEFESGKLKHVVYDMRMMQMSYPRTSAADILWLLRTAVLKSEEKREYAYGYFVDTDNKTGKAEFLGRNP